MTATQKESFLQQAHSAIDCRLNALLPDTSPCGQTPSEAILAARYALLGPGKRLRPALTLAVYSLYNSDPSPILDVACAIEMLHTYSLIHDDLPCIDNDDMRRGRPTVHKAFCESTALLAGDLLLTLAFETIAKAPLEPSIIVEMIREMGRLAGGHEGMIAGQVLDIQGENKQLSENQLEQIHRMKTGALIDLSVRVALMAANPPKEEFKLLTEFAQLYGLAFQVTDDILDVTHPEKKHGRKISSDEINHKSTYVSLLGVQGAKEKAKQVIEKASHCLKQVKKETSTLEEFLTLLDPTS